ncbi:MAG: 50S ribosomal protein L4, partial [Spirochaetaceae bacterium]|nr:50S ribosomal protein L4 [Spirochaetaceae bacterium]
MEVKVFSVKGEEIKAINLDDAVFNCEVSEGTIYYAINNELANMRIGTASTKGRGEVKGSGAKPWAQKGTGRARAGHKRSPLWVHGGVIFGPKPRDYSYKMPKAMKQNAMR